MFDRIHNFALNLFVYMALLFLLGSLIPAGIIVRWLSDTEQPLSAVTGKFVGWDAHKPNVALIEWTGIRNRSCPGIAYRYLIGDQVWDMPDRRIYYTSPVVQNPGKPHKWIMPLEIPAEARDSEDGFLNYMATIQYVCNPLHNWWPITFSVEDLVIPNPPFPATPPKPAN